MTRLLAVLVVSVATAACAAPVPSSSPITQATISTPSPAISCGDLAVVDCRAAGSAALKAVAGQGGTPIRVDLGPGVFCPTPGLLFKNTTCPGGALPPPEGGQWIGHALVTFAETSAQAYINIAKNGGTFRGAFIALATPPPATPSPS